MKRGLLLTLVEWYQDTRGVARFARALRHRLRATRRAGRGGWWHPACDRQQWFREQIIRNLGEGDNLDVGAFTMMAWNKWGNGGTDA